MNKLILILITTLLSIATISSQCCPYIDSLKILPENPNTADSIYLVAYITFPSGTHFIESEIENGPNNEISVSECYWRNDATVLSYFTNTYNFGVHEVGTYTVNYLPRVGVTPDVCLPVDSNSIDITFDVVGISSTYTLDESEVKCFPNPLLDEELWISSSSQIETILIMNLQGKILMQFDDLKTNLYKADIHALAKGTYLVNVIDDQKKRIVKKIVKL